MNIIKNEYIKTLNHPSKGFLTLLCYDVVFVALGFKWALLLSVLCGIVQLFIYAHLKDYLSQFLVMLSLAIVLITNWMSQLLGGVLNPIVLGWFPQGLTVAVLLTLLLWRTHLFKSFRDMMKRTTEAELRSRFDRLEFAMRGYLWSLGIHMGIILFSAVYYGMTFEDESALYLSYSVKFIVLTFSSFAEIGSIVWINNKLNKEEWIPIVAEDGSIKGRMAKALALTRKSNYRNPVVRIAFVYKDMLYLRPRPEETVFFKHKLDLPIGGYLPYGVEEKVYVDSLLEELGCDHCEPPRKMLRYVADGDDYKRLHSLYVVRANDEYLFKNSPLMFGGKLWTLSLIDSNLGKRVFSDFFEQEYGFLLQTLFVQYNKPKMVQADLRTIEAPI